jgi:hypothetical protein
LSKVHIFIPLSRALNNINQRIMKKVSLFLSALAMVAFVACNNAEEATMEVTEEVTEEVAEEATMEATEEATEEVAE